MRHEFAPLHGFDKAGFFLEVTRDNILHNLDRVAALLRRSLRELRVYVGGELHFHGS